MPSRLTATVREFARTVANPYDLDELLLHLTASTASALDAAGAGIMLEDRDGALQQATASDDRVLEAEKLQDRLGQGACFQAFSTDQVVVVDDINLEDRWPAYRVRMGEVGLGAVIGAPMTAAGQVIGVLNVYRAAPTTWTADDVDACEILAAMSAAYILSASQQRASNTLTEQLQHALDSRVIIEQARGYVMASDHLDADAAFEMLRTRARSSRRKLRDICQEVLDAGDVAPG